MEKILHISNGYLGSKVHSNLVHAIYEKSEDIKQFVYCPVTKYSDCSGEVNIDVDLFQKYFLRFPLLRYFPLIKSFFFFVGLLGFKFRNRMSPNILIAHTLWTDGILAFIFKFVFKTSYIVVVRSTDVNLFLRKLPHYRWLMYLIIRYSNKCVFINPSHKSKVLKIFPRLTKNDQKLVVIPNGVDRFWLNCSENYIQSRIEREYSVIFVGKFIKRKNIERSIDAVCKVRENLGLNITFKLVGGTRDELCNLIGVSQLPDWISVHGKISDKNLLSYLFSHSRIFLMPSLNETFGLVYVEAISNGCPIIYTSNEGIDGLVSKALGTGVAPFSVDEIALAIEGLMFDKPYGLSTREVRQEVIQFSWETIAEEYFRIIREVNIG